MEELVSREDCEGRAELNIVLQKTLASCFYQIIYLRCEDWEVLWAVSSPGSYAQVPTRSVSVCGERAFMEVIKVKYVIRLRC